MRPTVYAVILNRNNYADAREAILSLRSRVFRPRKTILVDNGSEDDSLARLRGDFPEADDVVFLEKPENQGFARGNNLGIDLALTEGSDAVFLLNNDATVAPDCLERLVAALADPAVGVVAPRIFYSEDRQRVWQGGGNFRAWKTAPVIPEANRLEAELSLEEQDASFLSGCALLVRREVFERIGGLSQDYFLYDEDVDFCLRASRAGFRLRYVPRAKVWHKIGRVEVTRTNPVVFFHRGRSRMILVRKNFSTAYFAYALLLHLGMFTPFRVVQWIRGSRSPGAVQAWFKGTWAGITDPLERE